MSCSLKHLLCMWLSVFGLLSGCSSSVKQYVDLPQKNFHVESNINAGGMLSSASASLHIFSIGKNCQREYLGSKLLGEAVEIGLPVGRQLELAVTFSESEILGNSSSSSAMSVLLTPHSKSYYVIKAEYDGRLQDIQLYKRSGKAVKPIDGESSLHCSLQ